MQAQASILHTLTGGVLMFLFSYSGRLVKTETLLAVFLMAQVGDGYLTYIGTTILGLDVEANPILFLLMKEFGVTPTLIITKVIAGISGSLLWLMGCHRLVAILTVVYLLLAILPWTDALMRILHG